MNTNQNKENIPWVEKYRPTQIDDIDRKKGVLQNFINVEILENINKHKNLIKSLKNKEKNYYLNNSKYAGFIESLKLGSFNS